MRPRKITPSVFLCVLNLLCLPLQNRFRKNRWRSPMSHNSCQKAAGSCGMMGYSKTKLVWKPINVFQTHRQQDVSVDPGLPSMCETLAFTSSSIKQDIRQDTGGGCSHLTQFWLSLEPHKVLCKGCISITTWQLTQPYRVFQRRTEKDLSLSRPILGYRSKIWPHSSHQKSVSVKAPHSWGKGREEWNDTFIYHSISYSHQAIL